MNENGEYDNKMYRKTSNFLQRCNIDIADLIYRCRLVWRIILSMDLDKAIGVHITCNMVRVIDELASCDQ